MPKQKRPCCRYSSAGSPLAFGEADAWESDSTMIDLTFPLAELELMRSGR